MKLSNLIVVFAVVLTSSLSFGQDPSKSTGIFDTEEEYRQFMGGAKRASVGNPEMMAMIPLINDVAQGRPIGSTARQYNSAGSELGLLSNKAIRQEIEMVDEQYQDLKNLNSHLQRRLAEQLRSVDFSDPQGAASQIGRMRDEAQQEIDALLLPHQVTRLRQIRFQTLLRNRSLTQILTSDPFRSDLDITDSQTEKLRQAEQEIREKMAEKIAKLQEEAREELISKLNPSQKAQVKDMIGDAFDLRQLSSEKKGWSKDGGKGGRRFPGKEK